jgi:hypothetical protein
VFGVWLAGSALPAYVQAASAMSNELLNQAWRLRAACRDSKDPDAWFAGAGTTLDRQRNRRAKQTCLVCPVKDKCQEFADSAKMPYGVWAGKRRNAIGEVSGHTSNGYAVKA